MTMTSRKTAIPGKYRLARAGCRASVLRGALTEESCTSFGMEIPLWMADLNGALQTAGGGQPAGAEQRQATTREPYEEQDRRPRWQMSKALHDEFCVRSIHRWH
jgi:hypothetical protein